MTGPFTARLVGPILRHGSVTEALLVALERLNPELSVIHRGSYVRVGAPGRCLITRRAAEEELGAPFALPADLERVMPSFVGDLVVTSEEAVWSDKEPEGEP